MRKLVRRLVCKNNFQLFGSCCGISRKISIANKKISSTKISFIYRQPFSLYNPNICECIQKKLVTIVISTKKNKKKLIKNYFIFHYIKKTFRLNLVKN